VKARGHAPIGCAAAIAGALLVASCGHSTGRVAESRTCVPAPIHTGPPPAWTAAAWSDSSAGFRVPYALASGDSAAAFMFTDPLRAGHPTHPGNKILWVVHSPRDGNPLLISARWSTDPSVRARFSQPADSSPGEIYPTGIDLPRPGCWKLTLTWGTHRASVDLQVRPPARRAASSSPASALPVVPRALHGMPLGRSTGLRLLVASDPPFLLDVDTGGVTSVSGLNVKGNPVLTVLAVGRDAVIWLDRRTPAGRSRAEIYVVRHGTSKAVRLTTGWSVAPARAGPAIWLLRFSGAHRCTLSELGLDGRTRRRARAIGCATQLLDTGSGAVLVRGRTVVDPATARNLPITGSPWAIAGERALSSSGSSPPLTLTDLRNGARRRLPWPSLIRGADQAVVQPHGRLIALDFADPAYRGGGTQVTDVWLLDPTTRRFRHLPDMPAALLLKFTSMAWTADGRLVMLAQTSGPGRGHDVVAVWRPGQRQIALRPVRLPARTSGSDTFVIVADADVGR
jgi:hypothetical protein